MLAAKKRARVCKCKLCYWKNNSVACYKLGHHHRYRHRWRLFRLNITARVLLLNAHRRNIIHLCIQQYILIYICCIYILAMDGILWIPHFICNRHFRFCHFGLFLYFPSFFLRSFFCRKMLLSCYVHCFWFKMLYIALFPLMNTSAVHTIHKHTHRELSPNDFLWYSLFFPHHTTFSSFGFCKQTKKLCNVYFYIVVFLAVNLDFMLLSFCCVSLLFFHYIFISRAHPQHAFALVKRQNKRSRFFFSFHFFIKIYFCIAN